MSAVIALDLTCQDPCRISGRPAYHANASTLLRTLATVCVIDGGCGAGGCHRCAGPGARTLFYFLRKPFLWLALRSQFNCASLQLSGLGRRAACNWLTVRAAREAHAGARASPSAPADSSHGHHSRAIRVFVLWRPPGPRAARTCHLAPSPPWQLATASSPREPAEGSGLHGLSYIKYLLFAPFWQGGGPNGRIQRPCALFLWVGRRAGWRSASTRPVQHVTRGAGI